MRGENVKALSLLEIKTLEGQKPKRVSVFLFA
jgi:hypothetical protein